MNTNTVTEAQSTSPASETQSNNMSNEPPSDVQPTDPAKPKSARKRQTTVAHSPPTNINDIIGKYTSNKYLFLPGKPFVREYAYQRLFELVASKLLEAYKNGTFSMTDDLSMLSHFYNSSTTMYQGSPELQSLVHSLQGDSSTDDIPVQYLQLVCALMEVYNFCILNSSVYIERRVVSRYKLFDILENATFTQVFPTESNSKKSTFKHDLSQAIADLRRQLVEENYRGLGKLRSSNNAASKKKEVPADATDVPPAQPASQPSPSQPTN